MSLLEKIIDLFVGAFLYKKGKDTEKLQHVQDELNALNEKNKIHDRLNTPEYRARLREHFKR